MRAVARLVWSYFAATKKLRAFTIVGLILLVIDFQILLNQPSSGEKLWLAILGIIFLFVGSSLMPVMFGRLARSHSISVLPGGRLKLLASAFITVVLIALPAGILSPASFVLGTQSVPEILSNPQARDYVLQLAAITFTSAMLFAGWIYVAMWFLASERSIAGVFKGLLVIMLVIFAPARDLRDLSMSLSWNLLQLAVIWIVFGSGFLLWPRFRAARGRRNRGRFSGLIQALSGRITGREFDLMLGTSNPWLQIAGLVLPIVIVSHFVGEFTAVWLYFLTIISVVTGAFSSQAAEKSRALWLRGVGSRAELFPAVERSVWHHNGIVLGALLLLTVGIGTYARFSPTLLTTGLLLLVLGTLLSTYLGLMVTRRIRWLEIGASIAVMLLLMALADLIGRESVNLATVLALEAGLALLAIVLRLVARRRWAQIDWTQCRADRALTVRGG